MNKFSWELYDNSNSTLATVKRMEVPGGHLYRYSRGTDFQIIFVPTPPSDPNSLKVLREQVSTLATFVGLFIDAERHMNEPVIQDAMNRLSYCCAKLVEELTP